MAFVCMYVCMYTSLTAMQSLHAQLRRFLAVCITSIYFIMFYPRHQRSQPTAERWTVEVDEKDDGTFYMTARKLILIDFPILHECCTTQSQLIANH